MHKYLSAIGFKELKNKKLLQKILAEVVMHPDHRSMTMNPENAFLAEFSKDFADDIGITVCGEFDEEEKFVYEYYYPYLKGKGISSYDDVSVERHAEKDSYSGVCDDLNLGITLIFYLKNRLSYVKEQTAGHLPVKGTTLTLSALSVSGSILFPIKKDEEQIERVKNASVKRKQLVTAARQGDEEAIETLTLEDMDLYSSISKKIHKEDVFSLVDTCIMPYGVECDQYSVLGEITNVRKVKNILSDEEIYILTIVCNELTFDVSINIMDLFGEPQVGRRFKGIVWMQGDINFPE